MKKFILPILCFVSLNCSCQEPKTAKLSQVTSSKIDALFAAFDREDSPGYAIGISKEGKTLYAKGYGSANLDYGIPIDENSAFSIASVSKQFTAACLALLIMDGKISLETPASIYIPELKRYTDVIRIKHLVYNTSGIPDYQRLERKDGKSWITFNYFDIDECITTSLEQELQFKPGERWDYCNVNFMLMAKIVEKVSGQSFAAFAQKRLFEPIGMTNTFIHDDVTKVVPNRVTPYNFRTQETVDYYRGEGIQVRTEGEFIQHHRNAPHYGGSGVVTTINDLLKWCKNMVTHSFGGQEFYNLIHRTEKFDHDRDNQAFGLYHGDFNGREMVAWDGGDWGISSQMMRFPKQGIAIIVLSNIGTGESFRRVNEIGDLLIAEGVLE